MATSTRYKIITGTNPENPFRAHVFLRHHEVMGECEEYDGLDGKILVVPPFVDGNALNRLSGDVGVLLSHVATSSYGTRIDIDGDMATCFFREDGLGEKMTPDEHVEYTVKNLVDYLGETSLEVFLNQVQGSEG